MQIFDRDDTQMISHTVDVMGDRISDGNDYTEQDGNTITKLDELKTPALVVDGAEHTDYELRAMLRRIVTAELDHWVPGASQRLIYRASRALGESFAKPRAEDHGPNPEDHALTANWVAGLYLRQCATCQRLFRDR